MKKLFLLITLALTVAYSQAQTADEILNRYFENTGGISRWKALKGVKITASVNQGGMEIPITQYRMSDGRQAVVINFQGKEIKQQVFDGTNLWSHNFMTMKAEKSDAESTQNFKQTLGDFPDAFLDYKTKGYKVELMGKETVEGSECFKIKLTKKPIMVDGKSTESISFYYFDANDFVPIMTEEEIHNGQAKGMIAQSKMSDYTDVNGLMFPFSLSEGMKGSGSQGLQIKNIELNPAADASVFKFPTDK